MADEVMKRRNVAFEKSISGLSKDDVRVKVVGTIIEKDDTTNSILIDDGKAQLRILFDVDSFNKAETGKMVSVIGLIAPALEGDTVELKGEILQDFSKLDPELYAKYLKIKDI